MNIIEIQQYITKRDNLTAKIKKSILEAISDEIIDLPEEAAEELGESIIQSSDEIAETIFNILSCPCDCDEEEY